MRILLLSANTEPFPEPVFPIGAVYVANALQEAGARVRIIDMRLTNTGTSLRKGLTAFRPDRIGISLRYVTWGLRPVFTYRSVCIPMVYFQIGITLYL